MPTSSLASPHAAFCSLSGQAAVDGWERAGYAESFVWGFAYWPSPGWVLQRNISGIRAGKATPG
jgi:hypothetical protein